MWKFRCNYYNKKDLSMENYDACNWTNNNIQKNVKLTLELRIEQEKKQFFVGNTLIHPWYSHKGCAIETQLLKL